MWVQLEEQLCHDHRRHVIELLTSTRILTFLQVHHSLCIVLQCMVYPPQAPVGQSFSYQIIGLCCHTQVLLLEDHGPLIVPKGFIGQSQVAVGSTLATHTSRLLRNVQSPLVPLEQERLNT